MARKTNTKNRTECQKNHFSDTVVRTLKAKIKGLHKKSDDNETILQFFAQSLGNTHFVWNHFLALTQQKYQNFKTLSEDEKKQNHKD